MDASLKERLNILKEAGEIDGDIMEVIISFAESFEKKYEVIMTEANASMLITHMAMALARIKKGEKVSSMDQIALEEVKSHPIYKEMPKFYKMIEDRLLIEIPESEKGFIALHAASLIENK
ncbi:PRD domain-containing protein [Proteinivorax hydrogeniformans]|uniref:PRD domain-containing protein n=1 Tax=Proteinivorax hydrogeniformans TaxID=1826727 RepID=A0AAU8HQQ2_9FIRM